WQLSFARPPLAHGRSVVPTVRRLTGRSVFVPAALTIHAVGKRVDHHVTARQPELGDKALNPMARASNRGAPDDRFMLGRVLTNHQQPRGAIQSAAMKDGTPLGSEIFRRKDVGTGHVLHKRVKWLIRVATSVGRYRAVSRIITLQPG